MECEVNDCERALSPAFAGPKLLDALPGVGLAKPRFTPGFMLAPAPQANPAAGLAPNQFSPRVRRTVRWTIHLAHASLNFSRGPAKRPRYDARLAEPFVWFARDARFSLNCSPVHRAFPRAFR